MIEHLHIRNVALIKEADIDFFQGLNILSGETGAGKSMIIDSINFLIGQKADKDFISNGEEEALVEGLFVLENDDVSEYIKDMGIDVEDNYLLISRTIKTNSRGSIKVNGRSATVSMLKDISQFLLDIHGQHQHQSLLNSSKHIELLDKFCGKELEENKESLNLSIKNYRQINQKIKEITKDSSSLGKRLDFIKFQIEEIESANLKKNEEEELLAKRRILVNSERLTENIGNSIELLYGNEGGSAVDNISSAISLINSVSQDDENLERLLPQLESILSLLDDSVRDIRKYYENIETDPEALKNIEERLELIYSLKRKYGNSVESILDYYSKIKEEYDFLINSEELLQKFNLEKKEIYKKIIKTCRQMTEIRKKEALILQKEIEDVLRELGMKAAKFEIEVSQKQEFGTAGNDNVEFLISPNPGEPLKSLSKIASGGEMSRVMLALKTVLSKADNIDTFIFDEIDSGVSGRIAQKVAEKLAIISRKKQILCVSHLPQIASMADNHYLIVKSSKEDKTETSVKLLDYSSSVDEIARLLGGAEITEAAVANAKDLKNGAIEFKNHI